MNFALCHLGSAMGLSQGWPIGPLWVFPKVAKSEKYFLDSRSGFVLAWDTLFLGKNNVSADRLSCYSVGQPFVYRQGL